MYENLGYDFVNFVNLVHKFDILSSRPIFTTPMENSMTGLNNNNDINPFVSMLFTISIWW